MELELIELFINPDPKDGSGATAIATVDNPAINQNYFAFNSSLKKYNIQLSSNKDVFKPVDGDKQILAGALMIPEMEIYRVDDATGKEYNVKFTKDTIEQIVKKFSQLNFANNINQMHDPNKIIKDSLQSGKSVLIHCRAGISRSVTILIAFFLRAQFFCPAYSIPNLIKSDNTWTETILNYIRIFRPIANPNPGFYERLLKYEISLLYNLGYKIQFC